MLPLSLLTVASSAAAAAADSAQAPSSALRVENNNGDGDYERYHHNHDHRMLPNSLQNMCGPSYGDALNCGTACPGVRVVCVVSIACLPLSSPLVFSENSMHLTHDHYFCMSSLALFSCRGPMVNAHLVKCAMQKLVVPFLLRSRRGQHEVQ